MTTAPYNSPLFRHVAELSQQVAENEAAATIAQSGLQDLQKRRQALSLRLMEVNSRRPAIEDGIDPDLIDALAADPSAEPDPERVAKRAEDHREAFTRWEADQAIVTHAIARIDGELEAAGSAVNAASGPGSKAFREFVEGAHEALLAAFIEGLQKLKTSYLEPMRILAAMDVGGRITGGRTGSDHIVSYSKRRLGSECKIETEQYLSGNRSTDSLLSTGPLTPEEHRTGMERLERFRSDLEAAGSASPKRSNKSS